MATGYGQPRRGAETHRGGSVIVCGAGSTAIGSGLDRYWRRARPLLAFGRRREWLPGTPILASPQIPPATWE